MPNRKDLITPRGISIGAMLIGLAFAALEVSAQTAERAADHRAMRAAAPCEARDCPLAMAATHAAVVSASTQAASADALPGAPRAAQDVQHRRPGQVLAGMVLVGLIARRRLFRR